MRIYQYMRIYRTYVTPEICQEYNLTNNYFDSKGFAYLEIRHGMYGLKEAAILAYDQLKDHLSKFGYVPFKHTPGFFRHESRPTVFSLAVDDFGIKYYSQQDVDHLFSALRQKYTITTDMVGDSYLGFTINWHYDDGYVDVSTLEYVPKAIKKFQHSPPQASATHSALLDKTNLRSTHPIRQSPQRIPFTQQ